MYWLGMTPTEWALAILLALAIEAWRRKRERREA